ncbi:DNA/RNA helicases [Thiohalobacter thiocyanaticus]|uniref:DNA/RNA helicases n=1 Tax=Thiohalobacter thiocyanaticus TaxID=585455 RepID=A0A1Z4VRC4_9GAMM|nr:DEAD/DEAH box helicase [Thiohalobacter thiocyanaticus]BAZ93754.1 DNA/RNA helicases [Thiohalobacter thiocyanaticus]
MAELAWHVKDDGVEFQLQAEGKRVPLDQWGMHSIDLSSGQGTPGPLLARMEDGIAQPQGQDRLFLRHDAVADLDDDEAAQLGLPEPAPYRLQIRGQGLLASPGFELKSVFVTYDSRPVMGLKRHGAVLIAAGKTYLLHEPLYSIVKGIEHFRASPPKDMDERFARWAELRLLLPEDAVVGDQLKNMNIVRPDALTLNMVEDDQFDPVLLTRTSQSEVDLDDTPEYSAILPESHHDTFANRFRELDTVRHHYALGGGWYVLVPEHVQKALTAVKKAQDRPAPQRRAFLANPFAAIREELGDDAETDLEDLFEETPEFLSERVQAIGEWVPKANVYMLPKGNQWLPPEEVEIAIPVDNALLSLKAGELPDALEKVEEALANGQREVTLDGQTIAVSEEVADTLSRLVVKPAGDENVTTEPHDKKTVLAPVLIDNIDELGYQAPSQRREGEAGGLPVGLKTTTLFPHQVQGLRWLQQHWIAGSPGALLADDMGLGKTLQTLAFLAWHKEMAGHSRNRSKPYLIVAPTGLLKNWADEAESHLMPGALGSLVKAFGQDLKELTDLGSAQRKQRLQDAEWILTTYETLRDKISLFLPVEWGVLVFDEAQKIKNPAARLTEAAKSLKSDFTLLLTGTPVENRLADLWCIVDAAAPGFLCSMKEFHDAYEVPSSNASDVPAELRTMLQEEGEPPLMLRRLKEHHLDGLPDKQSNVIRHPMPTPQIEAYDAALAKAMQAKGKRGAMLEVLHGLRMSSLLPQRIGNEGVTDEVVETSARLMALVEILDEISNKAEKVLVFLESLKLQEYLIPYLQQRYRLHRPPVRISGQVGGAERKSRVDEFQNGPEGQFDVMILSPKAGGVGLTLTAANHVIHLSRWWNPAVEDQCTDRVYRIGQKRPVTVYYPLAEHPRYGDGSFDVKLHELLESKRSLSQTALSPPALAESEFENFYDSVLAN